MHDGNNAAAPSLGGKMCGQDVPQPIVGTGNEVFIQFHTDFAGTRPGFAIQVDARKYLGMYSYNLS